ncbi:MAG: 4-alpha-glucanotransferase [Candidatus Thorarchaeota archaeon]
MHISSQGASWVNRYSKCRRLSGILLHPTSLPGKWGIGDLGSNLYKFIDFLVDEAHQSLWQILPLGQTGYGNSPYSCVSAFAGNPLLINPEKLVIQGLLDDLRPVHFPDLFVDFNKVIPFKWKLLKTANQNFKSGTFNKLESLFERFVQEHSFWLEDYCLFMSIKKAHNMASWTEWKPSLRNRKSESLSNWRENHNSEISLYKFVQFLFWMQWTEAKEYANQKGVKIIGDIPIFVDHDSADVWVNRRLFHLNDEGNPTFVAGVPPDYFSPTGQRWGNPTYRWEQMKEDGYGWWIRRIKHSLRLVDILRIDHFRGFESYWQIPAEEETALNGKWVAGPGIRLFSALRKTLGLLPIIAEDLGYITPEVEELLNQTGFYGMRVLQFAFGSPHEKQNLTNKYLPHNFTAKTIVYTGTHDNPPTFSWFKNSPRHVRQQVLEYTNSPGKDIVGDLIRLAWSSVAQLCVIPLQDLLRLGQDGRMNTPGTSEGNWQWRFSWNQLTAEKGKELAALNGTYGRQVQ